MKDTSCTSSYNGSQYNKTFWRTMFWSWVQAEYTVQWLVVVFDTQVWQLQTIAIVEHPKWHFCVCVCVRDPELVNLKWKRLFQGVLTPYCSAGSLRDLIKVFFGMYCILYPDYRTGISSFLVSNSASHRFSQVDSSVSCATYRNSSSHQVFCLWFGLSETCCWSETLEGPMREELTSG